MNSETALERVNYFHGQLLSAADFQAEQEYFLARLRRQNRYLHGWGVVSGLKVSAAGSSEIVVEPGLAIDCAGNEIYLCGLSRHKIPNIPGPQFVVIEYSETKTSPIPLASRVKRSAVDELPYSRIQEGFRIDVVSTDPTSGHRGKGAGTPGCGCAHQVCIARLRKRRKSWMVEQRGRRRS